MKTFKEFYIKENSNSRLGVNQNTVNKAMRDINYDFGYVMDTINIISGKAERNSFIYCLIDHINNYEVIDSIDSLLSEYNDELNFSSYHSRICGIVERTIKYTSYNKWFQTYDLTKAIIDKFLEK